MKQQSVVHLKNSLKNALPRDRPAFQSGMIPFLMYVLIKRCNQPAFMYMVL